MRRMLMMVTAAVLLGSAGQTKADPAYDADLYQRAYVALQGRQYEVALPLLIEFQGVCANYTEKHPRLCEKVAKAISDIETAIEQQKRAGSDYYARGDGGGSDTHLLARVDPPPAGGF
jgi:hypothetical protein